jgi:hypothetical protein
MATSVDGHPPADAYESFVWELAHSPHRAEVLETLRRGHDPDVYGWCRHSSHASRWERHPCPTRRLADLADEWTG